MTSAGGASAPATFTSKGTVYPLFINALDYCVADTATNSAGVAGSAGTDNTAGLASAIAALAPGGTIYVPAAAAGLSYGLAGQVNLNKPLRLLGDGPGRTVFQNINPGNDTTPLFLNSSYITLEGFEINAMQLRGTSRKPCNFALSSTGTGLSHLRFRHLYIHGFQGVGIYVVASSGTGVVGSDNQWEDCLFDTPDAFYGLVGAGGITSGTNSLTVSQNADGPAPRVGMNMVFGYDPTANELATITAVTLATGTLYGSYGAAGNTYTVTLQNNVASTHAAGVQFMTSISADSPEGTRVGIQLGAGDVYHWGNPIVTWTGTTTTGGQVNQTLTLQGGRLQVAGGHQQDLDILSGAGAVLETIHIYETAQPVPVWAGTPFTGAATTGGNLVGGTTYYYRLASAGLVGTTAAGAERSYTPPAGTSTNAITLNWTSALEDPTNIYRGTAANGELLLATVAAGVQTYTDSSATVPAGAYPTASTHNNLIDNHDGTYSASFTTTGSYTGSTTIQYHQAARVYDNCLVRNCRFTGTYINPPNNTRGDLDGVFFNCVTNSGIESCRQVAGNDVGLDFEFVHGSWIDHCYTEACVNLGLGSDQWGDNCRFTNNIVKNVDYLGLNLERNTIDCLVAGNVLINNGRAITVDSTCYGCQISDNQISWVLRGRPNPGSMIQYNGGHGAVTGNTLRGPQSSGQWGIELTFASKMIVSGNKVEFLGSGASAGTHCLYIQAGDRITVENNTLTNGQYGVSINGTTSVNATNLVIEGNKFRDIATAHYNEIAGAHLPTTPWVIGNYALNGTWSININSSSTAILSDNRDQTSMAAGPARWTKPVAHGASYTITSTDGPAHFYNGSGAATFTLPPAQPGLLVEIFNQASAAVAVTVVAAAGATLYPTSVTLAQNTGGRYLCYSATTWMGPF